MEQDKSNTITANSSRAWIDRHPLKLQRYLRRSHKREDRMTVLGLLYHAYPDEGRQLVENFNLEEIKKKEMLINFLLFQPQITCGLFADQRMGKDALLCKLYDDILEHCKKIKKDPPRIVTLGNMRKPPFVTEEDMYFSFKNIPSGTAEKEVWIYSSEIETVLPAREGLAPENKLFSQLEGTMAQNHQKLFGCCKLASKVDLNFIRGMNVKLFKYISPEKLNIEGVERVNILSELGRWLLPSNMEDKSGTLMCFANQLFTVDYDLPDWWSSEYSEQFNNIPIEKVWDYVEAICGDEMKISHIQIAVQQKFRVTLSKQEIQEHLDLG